MPRGSSSAARILAKDRPLWPFLAKLSAMSPQENGLFGPVALGLHFSASRMTPEPRLLEPRTLTRGLSGVDGAYRTADLPAELVGRSVRRLRVLCCVLGGMALIYGAIILLMRLGVLPVTEPLRIAALSVGPEVYAVVVATLVLAGGLLSATYWKRLSPRQVLHLALVLQVFGALCIATAENLRPLPPGIRGASGVCIWIMTFSLIPMRPRRAALAAFAAACMGPAGLAVNGVWVQGIWPAPLIVVGFFLPNLIAGVIAVLASAMIHRLGTDVTRARRLGSYRLVERLGQGGMGEVWRAEHESLIRPAAVKLLRPDLPGLADGSDRDVLIHGFRREVQITAMLQSPHTVAVYDSGQSTDGTFYYVMELLRGINLEELAARFGPLPAERVVHILLQVSHSLADAHQHGLIHGDIKPANIQLCALGMEHDFVKVLDFGLARHLHFGGDARLSLPGTVKGTPAYMAPETIAKGDADARSDLYSLGCVAYWLLTGSLVFRETQPIAMMAAHALTQPEPPTRRTEMPIPRELEEIVMSLLAKDPEARPQSATEMASRLAAVPLASPWTQERSGRWWQYHLPHMIRRITIQAETAALASP